MTHYTEDELRTALLNKMKGSRDPWEYYKADVVNYRGKTVDGSYGEIISKLIVNERILLEINKIDLDERKKDFHTNSHNGEISKSEKHLAIALFNAFNKKGQHPVFTFLDYEVPLKFSNAKNDRRGKIDLVAVDENGTLCLIELKPPENAGNKDTLLRATLEIYTYHIDLSRENNHSSFVEDFKKLYPETKKTPFRKIVLIAENSVAGEVANDLDKYPAQKELYDSMGVEIYTYAAKDLTSLEMRPSTDNPNKLKPMWIDDFPCKRVFPKK